MFKASFIQCNIKLTLLFVLFTFQETPPTKLTLSLVPPFMLIIFRSLFPCFLKFLFPSITTNMLLYQVYFMVLGILLQGISQPINMTILLTKGGDKKYLCLGCKRETSCVKVPKNSFQFQISTIIYRQQPLFMCLLYESSSPPVIFDIFSFKCMPSTRLINNKAVLFLFTKSMIQLGYY